MNIFYKFINFFRFKEISNLNEKGDVCAAVYRNPKKCLAVLNNGKVVSQGFVYVSTNMLNKTQNLNKDYMFAVSKSINGEGVYHLLDRKGNDLTPNGLFCANDDYHRLITKKDSFGNIIVQDYDDTKFIIYPTSGKISETYTFEGVGELNHNDERVVTTTDGLSYYVSGYGKKLSPKYLTKSDEDKYGSSIILMPNPNDEYEYVYVIMDKNHQAVSEIANNILYTGEDYILSNQNDETYFVDSYGERLTENFKSAYYLNNGVKVLNFDNGKHSKLLDKNNKELCEIYGVNVNKDLGVILGIVNGKAVVTGYDASKLYAVDENVAKMYMSKLKGKRLNAYKIETIINEGVDVHKTTKAFDKVLKTNAKSEPENEALKLAADKASKDFEKALNTSSERRIKKYNRNMEEIQAKFADLTKLYNKNAQNKGLVKGFKKQFDPKQIEENSEPEQ